MSEDERQIPGMVPAHFHPIHSICSDESPSASVWEGVRRSNGSENLEICAYLFVFFGPVKCRCPAWRSCTRPNYFRNDVQSAQSHAYASLIDLGFRIQSLGFS